MQHRSHGSSVQSRKLDGSHGLEDRPALDLVFPVLGTQPEACSPPLRRILGLEHGFKRTALHEPMPAALLQTHGPGLESWLTMGKITCQVSTSSFAKQGSDDDSSNSATQAPLLTLMRNQ